MNWLRRGQEGWRRAQAAAVALVSGGGAPTDWAWRAVLNEGSGAPYDSEGNQAVLDTSEGPNAPLWVPGGPYGDAPYFEQQGAANTGCWRFDFSGISDLIEWSVSSWSSIETASLSRWIQSFTANGDTSIRLSGHYPYDNSNGMWVMQYNGDYDSENYNSHNQNFRGVGWVHWITTYSEASQTFSLYRDGEKVGSAPSNVNRSSGSLLGETFDRCFIAGQWFGQQGIQGSVQDVRLYSRVLSDDEAAAIHAEAA